MPYHFKDLVFEGGGVMGIVHVVAMKTLGKGEMRRAEGGRS